MDNKIVIKIKPNGDTVFVYDDELQGIIKNGTAKIERASHVEPKNRKWEVDLTPVGHNQILGPFDTKREALIAEVDWLQKHILRGEPIEAK